LGGLKIKGIPTLLLSHFSFKILKFWVNKKKSVLFKKFRGLFYLLKKLKNLLYKSNDFLGNRVDTYEQHHELILVF
jgi:hypothetical protein